MDRDTLIRAADGDLIDAGQCEYLSPIDGQPCQDDAGHDGGHSIGGNPRYAVPVDADALLARVRQIRAVDTETGVEIPAPRAEQAAALAALIKG